MYNSYRDLLDALHAAPVTINMLLSGLSQEKALAAKGGDESWSIVEVICHLRDAEEFAVQRATLMKNQDNPDIIPYNQEQLAKDRHYAAQDMQTALLAFIRFRQQHIAVLESLTPEGWERSGNHLETGRITIFNHTLHIACHDAIHCAQISRQLSE